jgi:hypothetical protein
VLFWIRKNLLSFSILQICIFLLSYDWLSTWFRSFYDWLHFGYSHKRRRRAGYPKCPDTEKTKRLEAAWNRIKFWKKTPDTYECQNDDPVLQIDWYERHLMDIGDMEETYEYYYAKQTKKNEEPLSEYQWAWMKRREKNQPREIDSET